MKHIFKYLSAPLAFALFGALSANAEGVVVVIENMPDNCQRENDGTITCDGYTVDEFCHLFGSSNESFCYAEVAAVGVAAAAAGPAVAGLVGRLAAGRRGMKVANRRPVQPDIWTTTADVGHTRTVLRPTASPSETHRCHAFRISLKVRVPS